MTDKELIKKEIERLKHNTPNAYDLSRFMLLEEIESFINSLPEESGCEVNFTTKSEDLEEEIEKWIKEKHFVFTEIDEIIETARHFAEWQKQQMMKDAVEGEYWDGSIYLDNHPAEYKDGYKVKIIIVKEEQQ